MIGQASDPSAKKGSPSRAPSRGQGWRISVILGPCLFLVYVANARELGTDDTLATTLLPLSLARGEGFSLDRFSPLLREGDRVPPFVAAIPRPDRFVLPSCSGIADAAVCCAAGCLP